MIVACAVLSAALAACGGGGATAALPSAASAAHSNGLGQPIPSPAPSQSSVPAAPAGVGFDGQPVGTTFFANNALARPLSQNPRIDPQSTAMVAAMTVGDIGHLQFDPNGDAGTVVSTGHASDPMYSVRCLEPWGACSAPALRFKAAVNSARVTMGVPAVFRSRLARSTSGGAAAALCRVTARDLAEPQARYRSSRASYVPRTSSPGA